MQLTVGTSVGWFWATYTRVRVWESSKGPPAPGVALPTGIGAGAGAGARPGAEPGTWGAYAVAWDGADTPPMLSVPRVGVGASVMADGGGEAAAGVAGAGVVPFAADAGGDTGERVTADAGDSGASCALPRPSPAAAGDVPFGATGMGDAEAGVAVECEGDACAGVAWVGAARPGAWE